MNATTAVRAGALWARPEGDERRLSMKTALVVGLIVEVLLILLIARVDFSSLTDRPELKLIRATLYDPPRPEPQPEPVVPPPSPPPPPPPKEIKTVTRQAAPAPSPAPQPLPVPVEAPTQIAPATQPSASAPAVASTSSSLSGPATLGSGTPAGTGTGGKGASKGIDCPVQVKPIYPIAARREGLSGVTVVAQLYVDTSGKVTDVRIVSVNPSTRVFNGAVIAAARQYQCAKKSAPYDFPLTILFNLDDEQ